MTRYEQSPGTARASHSLQEIIPAAYHGRIEIMLVDTESRQWGTFDPVTDQVHLHREEEAADEDLLEFATVHTILNKGIVYTIEPGEMPQGASIAALFRHP